MSTNAHDTVAHKSHPILNKSTPFTKCTAKIVCGWWVDWEPGGLNLGCSNRSGHAEWPTQHFLREDHNHQSICFGGGRLCICTRAVCPQLIPGEEGDFSLWSVANVWVAWTILWIYSGYLWAYAVSELSVARICGYMQSVCYLWVSLGSAGTEVSSAQSLTMHFARHLSAQNHRLCCRSAQQYGLQHRVFYLCTLELYKSSERAQCTICTARRSNLTFQPRACKYQPCHM